MGRSELVIGLLKGYCYREGEVEVFYECEEF